MQTLTVAILKAISDGTATYGPGQSITVNDTDAPGLIAAGYVLIPNTDLSIIPGTADVLVRTDGHVMSSP